MARSIEKENLKDIQLLIKNVTGFKESEENFGICQQFAVSNLKYHRFLTVDSHKVTRTLDGICEKFRIHSEFTKYKKMKELSEKFLETVEFENKEVGKTDTHYGILSFLMLIAESPVKSEYVETTPVMIPEIKEEFNWFEYLMEGTEIYTPGDSDSSDWTDEEDTLEEKDIRVPSPARQDGSDRVVQLAEQQQLPYIVSDGSTLQWEEPGAQDGADWLARNLVAQYWRGEELEIETGKYRACHLNNDWEAYKEKINPLYGNTAKTVVTENILLRETIWMLLGVTDLYLYEYNGKYFLPRSDLAIPHLSQEVLRESLAEFTRYGSYIRVLQNFVEDCYPGRQLGGEEICQTYQAFASTVADFQQVLKTELSSIEQILIRQDEIVTLLSLSKRLRPLFQRVGVVFTVYVKGVNRGVAYKLTSQKATLLLTVLYNTLMGCDTLYESPDGDGTRSSELLQLLLPMWIQTSQPYINIIDTWISHGHLTDPCNEFIIHRNKGINIFDETYWEKSFTFHMMSRGGSGGDEGGADGDEGRADGNDPATYDMADWAPKFLQPVLQQIVLTGKSMEMLEGLGKLAEHDGKANIDLQEFKEGHLYDKFISSLKTLLGVKLEKEEEQSRDTTLKEEIFSPDIERQMKETGIFDNFLKTHFEKLMTREKLSHSIIDQDFTKTMESLELEGLQPVELILHQCLYPHIQQQYEGVCLRLVQLLKTEYSLLGYLRSMRKFFLMEAGDAMFVFYTQLFDKIRLRDHWKDTTSITWGLHEALDQQFPQELARLSVLVEPPAIGDQRDSQPINITNCLRMTYQVPCPVDVVINGRSQTVYNQIFSFLLQVKRAKYCLDELRFYDLTKESPLNDSDKLFSSFSLDTVPRQAKVHSMHLLRMRLINFVNSLHNYIMTRILHSTGLEFKRDLEMARDLDQVIEVHTCYVRKIHEQCLMQRKNAILKEAVLKVLNLALRLQTDWDQGIDQISMKQIEDSELEFSRCIQFLSSFLNSVIQRGSFPHLESLAFSLDMLVPS